MSLCHWADQARLYLFHWDPSTEVPVSKPDRLRFIAGHFRPCAKMKGNMMIKASAWL